MYISRYTFNISWYDILYLITWYLDMMVDVYIRNLAFVYHTENNKIDYKNEVKY